MLPDSPGLSPDSELLLPDGVVYAEAGTLRASCSLAGLDSTTGGRAYVESGTVRSSALLAGTPRTRYSELGTLRSAARMGGEGPLLPATDLNALAQSFLSQMEAALATTTGGTPSTSYISVADPSFDCCPMLAVWWRLVSSDVLKPNTPGDLYHRTGRGQLNLVQLSVVAIRCYPDIDQSGVLPTPAEYNAASALVNEDSWAVWNWVQQKHRSGELFPPYPCRDLEVGALQPVPPQGGCAGVTLSLVVHLDGYVIA